MKCINCPYHNHWHDKLDMEYYHLSNTTWCLDTLNIINKEYLTFYIHMLYLEYKDNKGEHHEQINTR